MMMNTAKYLQALADKLLEAPQHKIVKTKGWAADFPSKAGVYIIRRKNVIIYVGQTGNLQARMRDLCNTVNHSARRSVGKQQFKNHVDYTTPTSKAKLCDALEEELDKYFAQHLTVSFLPVELGRLELEEMFFKPVKPILNIKIARKIKGLPVEDNPFI